MIDFAINLTAAVFCGLLFLAYRHLRLVMHTMERHGISESGGAVPTIVMEKDAREAQNKGNDEPSAKNNLPQFPWDKAQTFEEAAKAANGIVADFVSDGSPDESLEFQKTAQTLNGKKLRNALRKMWYYTMTQRLNILCIQKCRNLLRGSLSER